MTKPDRNFAVRPSVQQLKEMVDPMTTQANDWSLQTHGDSWSGVSRIVDAHGMIVATGPEQHLKRILREHEQCEAQREALRLAVEALKRNEERMRLMGWPVSIYADNREAFEHNRAALAKCREALVEE